MTTLGLSLIVGDESTELERCLKSVQGTLFDSITVVTTKEAPETLYVALKYATKVDHFPWIDDFSAARNHCLDLITTDYVFWLDADDVIKPEYYDKLLALKPRLEASDVYLLSYIYAHDQNDRPINILPRERVFRRLNTIRWSGEVHESLTVNPAKHSIKPCRDICIDHYRSADCDPGRNLRILKKAYEKNPCPLTTFYYGRDLISAGKEEGFEFLKKFVEKEQGSLDFLTAACTRLAQFHYDKKDLNTAKKYLFKSLNFSNSYAEPYVLLALIYKDQGDIDRAITCNREALTKKLEAGFEQETRFYRLLPASNLSVLYSMKNDFIMSFKYNALALEYDPDNPGLINDRRVLVTPYNLRFAWVDASPNQAKVCEGLKDIGFISDLKGFGEAVNFDDYDAVIFNQEDLELMEALKIRNKKIVYDISEVPPNMDGLRLADLIICGTVESVERTRGIGFKNSYLVKNGRVDYPAIHRWTNLLFSLCVKDKSIF